MLPYYSINCTKNAVKEQTRHQMSIINYVVYYEDIVFDLVYFNINTIASYTLVCILQYKPSSMLVSSAKKHHDSTICFWTWPTMAILKVSWRTMS